MFSLAAPRDQQGQRCAAGNNIFHYSLPANAALPRLIVERLTPAKVVHEYQNDIRFVRGVRGGHTEYEHPKEQG